MKDIVENINNAFFRFENFANGAISEYKYFGFKNAFIALFNEAIKPDNYTHETCKLIGNYYTLANQVEIDYDKGGFDNDNCYDNNDFCKDCEELTYLAWDMVEEFCKFPTPTEKERLSIIDITQQAAPTESKEPKQRTFADLLINIEEDKKPLLIEKIRDWTNGREPIEILTVIYALKRKKLIKFDNKRGFGTAFVKEFSYKNSTDKDRDSLVSSWSLTKKTEQDFETEIYTSVIEELLG